MCWWVYGCANEVCLEVIKCLEGFFFLVKGDRVLYRWDNLQSYAYTISTNNRLLTSVTKWTEGVFENTTNQF